MAFDVLNVLGLLAVDVTRDIEVVLVLLDLLEAHHTGILGFLDLFSEDVDDTVNIHLTQTVLGTVLDEPLGGVDHEDALASLGILLVDHHDTGGVPMRSSSDQAPFRPTIPG